MKDIREHKVYGVQCAYVLDCIENVDEVSDKEMTDKEKIQFFFTRFNQEYGYPYNVHKYPSLQERIDRKSVV